MIRSVVLPAAVAAGLVAGLVAPAHARVHHRHHHRFARGVPPLPPSQSPIPPRLDGYAAGVFEAGIPGASSADPYDRSDLFRPGIGYIAPGE